MATTTNYGWDTPDDTDLVKDGALAMRDLGQDIDSSLFGITGGKNVGMVLLNATTFTGASTVTVDNVFTSAYNTYQIVLNCKNASANDVALSMQFRNAGSTIGGTAYTNNKIQSYGTFIGATVTTSTSNWQFGNTSQNNYSQLLATISNACLALPKSLNFSMAHGQSTVNIDSYSGYGINTTSTAYDGLIITTGGTITGTLNIYGLRKS